MELTVRQYADKQGIKKGYVSRIVREGKLHLLKGVKEIDVRTDAFGTQYYVLIMETNNKKK